MLSQGPSLAAEGSNYVSMSYGSPEVQKPFLIQWWAILSCCGATLWVQYMLWVSVAQTISEPTSEQKCYPYPPLCPCLTPCLHFLMFPFFSSLRWSSLMPHFPNGTSPTWQPILSFSEQSPWWAFDDRRRYLKPEHAVTPNVGHSENVLLALMFWGIWNNTWRGSLPGWPKTKMVWPNITYVSSGTGSALAEVQFQVSLLSKVY